MGAPRTRARTRGKRATGDLITRADLPTPYEIALHFQVAAFLDAWSRPNWEWTHFPAGEERHPAVAAKLQRMGTKPGWPDFILVSPQGLFHGLELKREGESLNDNQREFHDRAKVRGWRVAVADSFDEAVAILKGWGCLRITIVGNTTGGNASRLNEMPSCRN